MPGFFNSIKIIRKLEIKHPVLRQIANLYADRLQMSALPCGAFRCFPSRQEPAALEICRIQEMRIKVIEDGRAISPAGIMQSPFVLEVGNAGFVRHLAEHRATFALQYFDRVIEYE